MKTSNKKNIFIFLCALVFTSSFISAQELNPLEELKKYTSKEYDKDLQKEFVVIEQPTVHDFNPQTTALSGDNDILMNTFEGLFAFHPVTLDAQYAIATGYKISRDKKRWQITLRDNAYFSNGDKITAEDVRFSFIQLLSTPSAPYASLLDIVRGAKDFRNGTGKEEDVGIYVQDDYTIAIYLETPANYLPKILCHQAFSIVNKDPDVYSGAYCIDEKLADKTILKKNPYYWDKDNVAIEKVIFLQSDDPEENAYLYNTGRADWVMNGNVYFDRLLDPGSIQVAPMFGASFYFFKTSAKKPSEKDTGSVWDYPEFRNALLEAMPWKTLRNGVPVPATTFVYPLAGYPKVDGFDFTDPKEAEIKMKAAREKYNIPADEKLSIVFEVNKGATNEGTKTALANAFALLNIEVEFKETPGYIYFSNIAQSDSDVYLYSWIGDFADPLTFLELFRGGASLNDSGWHNDEYDKYLEKAAVVSDAERYKYLAEAEKILLDEGMIIPIAFPVSYNIINFMEVGGWYPNAFDCHFFKFIYKKRESTFYPNIVMR